MARSNVIDVEVFVAGETDRAIRVQLDEGADAVWLPKSQVEIDHSVHSPTAVVTLPEWLALDKGLI